MSVPTISRTAYNALVDDDGSGLTGSVWDKNDVKDILDAIDSMISGFYAEGTWTPTLKFGGNSVGIAYSVRTGTYTKAGNVVTIEGRIAITSKGSSTGTAEIAGLPFAAAGNPVGMLDWFNFTGLTAMPFVAVSVSSLFPSKSGGASRAQMVDTDFTNTADLRFSVVYRV